MATPVTLYAATGNKGKLREFVESAQGSDIEVLPLPGLAWMPEPIEDEETFEGNATLKAVAYSLLAPGLLVMADDSGLEVDALGGAPGVRSARFAADLGFTPPDDAAQTSPLDPHTKDGRNNLCLLAELARTRAQQPAGRFRCVLAVAQDGRVLHTAAGSVEGMILTQPRGSNGFGYDPLFWIPELNGTAAELTPEVKWQVSHRGRAFRALLAQLCSQNRTSRSITGRTGSEVLDASFRRAE
jgi:XTP/dITP diphosphohydrolase